MAEDGLLRFLKLKLTEEQANKFSVAERKFLLDKELDDVDAWTLATLDQLEEPPGGRGGLRLGRANMLLKAFGPGANTIDGLNAAKLTALPCLPHFACAWIPPTSHVP